MSEPLNAEQQKIKALWDSLPEGAKFDLEAALSAKATQPKSTVSRKVKEPKAAIAREAQAVIEHLMMKTPLALVKCQECKREYATTYKHVKFCGDVCRAEWMRREWGFLWDPDKSEDERWGFEYELPKVISPETLRKLKHWAKRILELGEPEQSAKQAFIADLVTNGAITRAQAESVLAPPRKNRFSSF